MAGDYDKSFKLLAGDDPRALLALVAGIPLEATLEVTSLERELLQPTLLVDNLYLCREPEAAPFLVHIEACTRYRADVPARQAQYILTIAAKYRHPIRSYLLLLTADRVPAAVPEVLRMAQGDFEATVCFRAVRMWTISGSVVLRLGRPALYAWAPLMDTTEAQFAEARERLAEGRSRELLLQLCLFTGLRYGKNREEEQRRLESMTMEEIYEESWVYQDILEKGAQRVRLQLQKEVDDVRLLFAESLRDQLEQRFGPLPSAAIEKIHSASPQMIGHWMHFTLSAPTLDDILNARPE